MQFFVVGLLVLTIYLQGSRSIGWAITILLTAGGVFCGWWVLDTSSEFALDHDPETDFFNKPYSRITPFTVGICMGMALVDHKIELKRLQSWTSSVLMFLSCLMVFGMIYVDTINFHPTVNVWSPAANAYFQSFGRLGFAGALAVITWLCISGNSRFVNYVLSLPFWATMGKLTLGVYLVHPIVIQCFYFQQVTLVHFVVFNQLVIFIAVTVLSYALAGMLYLMVELPFANIQRRVLLILRQR
jgi:peptidoglycan/LPS O-acetylase OafA/YrhL